MPAVLKKDKKEGAEPEKIELFAVKHENNKNSEQLNQESKVIKNLEGGSRVGVTVSWYSKSLLVPSRRKHWKSVCNNGYGHAWT